MADNRRRDFLKHLGAFSIYSPIVAEKLFFQAFLASLFQQARAEVNETDLDLNYLNIAGGGGAMRYCFDHWLRTNVDDPEVVVCAANATSFTYDSSGNTTGYEHRTHEYNGILVPHLFFTLPEAMRRGVLDGMLVIRGYGEDGGGHAVNNRRQQFPLGSAPSIAGIVNDYGSRPFGAVQARKAQVFKSATGVSPGVVNMNDPLQSLLGPLVANNNIRQNSLNYKEEFDEVRRALASISSKFKAADVANGKMKKAFELFNSSLGDFQSAWPLLVSKYETAMNTVARENFIPGLNATLDGSSQLSHPVPAGDGRYASDIGSTGVGRNLCQTNVGMEISLGSAFALAEYGFKNKLFSTLQSSFTGVELNLNPEGSKPTFFSFNNDAHGGGGRVAMVAYNFFHRGMAAGIYEFRKNMEALGLWDKTIVHYSSEFDRKISKKDTGSGHGTNQMISSVFTGRINNGPYVVGNIGSPEDREDSHVVSQAIRVPISGFGAEPPTTLAVASTLTEVFGSPNPWKSFCPPLVKRGATGLLSLPFGKGKVLPLDRDKEDI